MCGLLATQFFIVKSSSACKYFLKEVMPILSKVQKACWERLQGLVSDGSLYIKSIHWRGRTESVTGFVKSKYTMYYKWMRISYGTSLFLVGVSHSILRFLLSYWGKCMAADMHRFCALRKKLYAKNVAQAEGSLPSASCWELWSFIRL